MTGAPNPIDPRPGGAAEGSAPDRGRASPGAGGNRAAVLPAAAALLLGALLAPRPAHAQQESGYDYPETATPPRVVDEMLDLAGVGASDTVYDLGSGDGRIVIEAARRRGAAGVGIEIDSALVAEARSRAGEAGVTGRVRFVAGNFFRVDLRPATVVTTYLLPNTMERLRLHLFRELRPGTRIVSHDFGMEGWPADTVAGWWDESGRRTTLFRWVVPAQVGGTWELRLPDGDPEAGGGEPVTLRIDQRFQELRAEADGDRGAGGGVRAVGARVSGDSVRFRLARPDGATTRLRGVASASRMRGRTGRGRRWSARRTAFSDTSLVAWSDSAGAD